MVEAPRIDRRTAADIENEVRERLLRLIREDPAWPGPPCNAVDTKGALAALIAVFGRFSEIIIDRLNRSPQKNLLAFLDLIGVSRRPPQPARVPLTFGLATGTTQLTIVKKGTQAAAQPAKDETQPVIFETVRELVVSPVKIVAAYMMDHGHDRYYSWLPVSGPDALDLQDVTPVEHTLYIGFGEALHLPVESEIDLNVTLEKQVSAKLTVVWEIPTASGWQTLHPVSDETNNLSRSGVIRFTAPPVEPAPVNAVVSRWIRARLTTPLEGKLDLPTISAIGIQTTGGKTGLLPASAFAEFQPIDLTRDFLPFGARPGFGSTFYLSNPEALSVAGSDLVLHVEITNPASGGPEPPIPRTSIAGRCRLAWEIWNGSHWARIGVSETTADKTDEFPGFEDTTRAFTQSGSVRVHLPEPAAPLRVNGVVLPWLRVRIVSGDYGVESGLAPHPSVPGQGPVQPASPTPPAIHALTFEYRVVRKLDRPERIFDYNDFWWTDRIATPGSFQPFRSDKSLALAVYIGFDPPPVKAGTLGNRSISLYLLCTGTSSVSDETPPSVEWQYWSHSGWKKWTVRDETDGITDSGPIRFLPPPDCERRLLFGNRVYWLRGVWTAGGPPGAPIRRILMNTVSAVNNETIVNEILGSSNGTPGQAFRTLRSPVLDGPAIEIREPQRPLEEERQDIEADEGPDAIRIGPNELGVTEIWVRWHEVPDFMQSKPLDRHYVMDHITGEITFGDNNQGMIPPPGSGNIHASSYRTGGGAQGNRQPGEINSLKTTVPYVDRVYNYEPAEGGVDAEDESDLPYRGPSLLRHRDRAVAREDYEDLAMLATPEVGRAKCVPARDLATDPDGKMIRPGAVSVIVVPRNGDVKPVPNSTLLDTVREYLDQRRVPTADLAVVGPDYLRIDVEVHIGLDSLDAGDVELAATLALRDYLHPLTGGPHGTGWQFGRRLRPSELYKVIEPITGVRYVAHLEVKEHEEPRDAGLSKRREVCSNNLFLIYSGLHTVRLILPES